MKLFLLAAAPLAMALAAPATAQDRVVRTTTVTHHDKSVVHNGAARWRTKRVCKTSWSNHRKVRSCKNVRVRW